MENKIFWDNIRNISSDVATLLEKGGATISVRENGFTIRCKGRNENEHVFLGHINDLQPFVRGMEEAIWFLNKDKDEH